MRLSTVVELLLILLLVAFAAYGRVIEHNRVVLRSIRDASDLKKNNVGISTLSLKQATDNVNRYCTCNENICNCCRDFHIPLVQLQGPGCASLQYLQEDNLAVQLSFGDNILTSTIVNGKNPKPVCVPLPGGFTKFCGRIYSIQRDAKNHFKACLGLELQSSTELEASLRVSCFRFGPDGLKLRPAEPLPIVEAEAPEDDDDDDDFFGLGSEEDDENDDSEGDSPLTNSVPNSSGEDEDEDEDDDEDVLGFGALLDIITGDDESSTKKPKVTTSAPLLQFTIPILTKPTSVSPLESYEVSTAENSVPDAIQQEDEYNQSLNAEEEQEDSTEEDAQELSVANTTANEAEEIVTEASNKIAAYAKPAKTPTTKLTTSEANKKKPGVASNSIDTIENGTNKKKKPLRKPIKEGEDDDDDDDILGTDLDDDEDDDDDDDDDEDEAILSDDDDENDNDDEQEENYEEEEDEKQHENNKDEDEKAEEIEDLVSDDDDDDDDDDDAEDAVISALVYDEKEVGKKGKANKKPETSDADDDDDDDDGDYGIGLSGLLARSRHSRSGRQSKVMRLKAP